MLGESWEGPGRIPGKWTGGERHVIEDILRFVDTSSKTYFASRHMSAWWLLWQRHSLPIGTLSHSRACLIGLLHKHVEKFPALPLVQVGLTAVCFRSRPQPASTAAAHYPNHCCCLTHASQNIHYYSSTTATPFFICRSMAIIMILKAAESFVG